MILDDRKAFTANMETTSIERMSQAIGEKQEEEEWLN